MWLDLHCPISPICQPLCSVHFTTVRCCETSIWCLLLWLTSLWFSSLLERILSCQVNLQGLGCSHGPLVRIQTIPHFPLANVSRGQSPSSLQNQRFTEGNSNLKNSLTLHVLLYLVRLGPYKDATRRLGQLPVLPLGVLSLGAAGERSSLGPRWGTARKALPKGWGQPLALLLQLMKTEMK